MQYRGRQHRAQRRLRRGEVGARLDREEAPAGAVARHLEIGRGQEARELVDEAFDLDGGAAVNRLLHVEPGERIDGVERVEIEEKAVDAEDTDPFLIEARGEAEAFEHHRASIDARRRAAYVVR